MVFQNPYVKALRSVGDVIPPTDHNKQEEQLEALTTFVSRNWTLATRPTPSALDPYPAGYCTDLGQYEFWNGTNWVGVHRTWLTVNRPVPGVGDSNPIGYNLDLNTYEYWNGTAWIQLQRVWVTGTRPTPFPGDLFPFGYNTDIGTFEYWNGFNWIAIHRAWLTVNRPTPSVADPSPIGFNMDLLTFEYWNGAAWIQLQRVWAVATRPVPGPGDLFPFGFNTDLLVYEYWNGTAWVTVGGAMAPVIGCVEPNIPTPTCSGGSTLFVYTNRMLLPPPSLLIGVGVSVVSAVFNVVVGPAFQHQFPLNPGFSASIPLTLGPGSAGTVKLVLFENAGLIRVDEIDTVIGF